MIGYGGVSCERFPTMILRTCSVMGCSKPVKASGLCGNHYANNRRNGAPIPLIVKSAKRSTCKAPGCENKSSAKGFCSKHYARVVKHGSTELPPPKPKFVCAVDGCGEDKHKAHGLCRFHYERAKEGRKLELAKMLKQRGAICQIADCGLPHRAGGYCNKHYLRFINHGDPNYSNRKIEYGRGKDWHVQPGGYISRFEPSNPNAGSSGHVYQHRHVMSEFLGRPLKRNETVHHKNGDRSDNKLRNLELWVSSQPSGQRVTDKVKWCIEFLSSETLGAALKIDPSLVDELAMLRARLKAK